MAASSRFRIIHPNKNIKPVRRSFRDSAFRLVMLVVLGIVSTFVLTASPASAASLVTGSVSVDLQECSSGGGHSYCQVVQVANNTDSIQHHVDLYVNGNPLFHAGLNLASGQSDGASLLLYTGAGPYCFEVKVTDGESPPNIWFDLTPTPTQGLVIQEGRHDPCVRKSLDAQPDSARNNPEPTTQPTPPPGEGPGSGDGVYVGEDVVVTRVAAKAVTFSRGSLCGLPLGANTIVLRHSGVEIKKALWVSTSCTSISGRPTSTTGLGTGAINFAFDVYGPDGSIVYSSTSAQVVIVKKALVPTLEIVKADDSSDRVRFRLTNVNWAVSLKLGVTSVTFTCKGAVHGRVVQTLKKTFTVFSWRTPVSGIGKQLSCTAAVGRTIVGTDTATVSK